MKKSSNKLRIAIVGGGTGGHITPALAVAEQLRQHHRVWFIGSAHGPEGKIIKDAGYVFRSIQAGKLRRYFSLENFIDSFRILIGFVQAWIMLERYRPDAIFAKGGYVTVPVVYAASFLNIPVVAHESDVVMGLANRLVFHKATMICTGFPVASYTKALQSKLHFTGNPIRNLFRQKLPDRTQVLKKLGLSNSRPVVLMLGGSQGALPINQLLWEQLEIALESFQLIHLTGVDHIGAALDMQAKLPVRLRKRYLPYGYANDELIDYMTAADIVVSRGSANVLTELTAVKKPTIIIPLPHAASDHQRANARLFKKKGAAVVLEEIGLTSSQLLRSIEALLNDRAKQRHISQAMQLFYSPNAAKLIAETIVRVVRKG
jgi:UDP-N-acetylglucosamine--N-acetylmuramyl-(pentapeptide) pyrophosphoryl-undecaprenol N-acetylglucosamine transferase